MTSSITVAFVLLVGSASALRGRRRNDLITSTPYNNQHSDATAARDESAMMLG